MIKIMKAQKLRSDDVQDAMVISVLVILMLGLYFLAAYLFMRLWAHFTYTVLCRIALNSTMPTASSIGFARLSDPGGNGQSNTS
jgi:hypothetical protein